MLESGWPSAIEDLLLGLPVTKARLARVRSKSVQGLRALVHGHEPVEEVERTANRWDIDTGAGIRRFNRVSLL